MTLQENFSVVEYLDNIPEEQTHDRLVSYSFKWEHLSIAFFFEQLSLTPRVLWSQDGLIHAGSDAAVILTANGDDRFRIIQKQLNDIFLTIISNTSQNPFLVPKLFGGFSFDNDSDSDSDSNDTSIWSKFPPAYFILPKYQYTQIKNECWLTINLIKHKNETNKSFGNKMASETEFLKQILANNIEKPQNLEDNLNNSHFIHENKSLITKEQWADQINYIVTNIGKGTLKKAVLSRIYRIKKQQSFAISTILSKLEKKFPSCYIFCFEPIKNQLFFGASPELLANVMDSSLEVHALAGSNKRGTTEEEDEIYANELLNNPKERAEHKFVIDQIRQKLTPFTTQLEIPDTPKVLKLKNIQHLKTIIRGKLINKSEVIPVIQALHPTPAVGGVPQQIALDTIKKLELYSRGWYASPVGWISQNGDGTFAVAIRSAVVNDNEIWLYAGAGIVNGSTPDNEWKETQLKFSALLDILES